MRKQKNEIKNRMREYQDILQIYEIKLRKNIIILKTIVKRVTQINRGKTRKITVHIVEI